MAPGHPDVRWVAPPPRALLRAADAAMYQAKLAGKNGVSYFVASRVGVVDDVQPS